VPRWAVAGPHAGGLPWPFPQKLQLTKVASVSRDSTALNGAFGITGDPKSSPPFSVHEALKGEGGGGLTFLRLSMRGCDGRCLRIPTSNTGGYCNVS
jgi:hypothetical protein